MGVLLEEVIEAGGYDISTKEDAIWLLSTQNEYAELIEAAEDLLEGDEQ